MKRTSPPPSSDVPSPKRAHPTPLSLSPAPGLASTIARSVAAAGALLVDFLSSRRPGLAGRAYDFWNIDDDVLDNALVEMFTTMHRPGIARAQYGGSADYSPAALGLCFESLSGVHGAFREGGKGFEREPFRSGVRKAVRLRVRSLGGRMKGDTGVVKVEDCVVEERGARVGKEVDVAVGVEGSLVDGVDGDIVGEESAGIVFGESTAAGIAGAADEISRAADETLSREDTVANAEVTDVVGSGSEGDGHRANRGVGASSGGTGYPERSIPQPNGDGEHLSVPESKDANIEGGVREQGVEISPASMSEALATSNAAPDKDSACTESARVLDEKLAQVESKAGVELESVAGSYNVSGHPASLVAAGLSPEEFGMLAALCGTNNGELDVSKEVWELLIKWVNDPHAFVGEGDFREVQIRSTELECPNCGHEVDTVCLEVLVVKLKVGGWSRLKRLLHGRCRKTYEETNEFRAAV